jgi:hypothetical protein
MGEIPEPNACTHPKWFESASLSLSCLACLRIYHYEKVAKDQTSCGSMIALYLALGDSMYKVSLRHIWDV